MLSRTKILELFEELNIALKANNEIGEVGIVGGAVMCLVYNARSSTKDIDAIFEPSRLIRKLTAQIAERNDLPNDWLNDAVKGFLQPSFQRQEVLALSNLRVWAPEARYMLAMKCISARWDTHDKSDVQFLIRFLKLKTAKEIFKIIEHYYPQNKILSKTKFLIEELME